LSQEQPKQEQSEPQPAQQAEAPRAEQQQQPASEQPSKRHPEKHGILRFFREMGSALAMALVAIVYIIQAFQIPTGSMEDSLLVGDFLLGLKFVYGAPLIPFSQELGVKARFPAVKQPKPGDVVIFRYPGFDKKDYIKRMVAGPGDTVQIVGNRVLFVNDTEIKLPPRGKYTGGVGFNPRVVNFAPLYIPAKGDVLKPETMPVREFLFAKNLIHQENPTKRVQIRFDLYVDGQLANDMPLNFPGMRLRLPNNQVLPNNFSSSLNGLQSGKIEYREPHRFLIFNLVRTVVFDFSNFDDWTALDDWLDAIRRNFSDRDVEIRKKLFLDDRRVESYTVEFDNYFMIGDNRDNSLDSRYWGYLNRNFVKAKAFILYFSFDSSEPVWEFPTNIRWNRIGKLIRDWDGVTEPGARIKY
jgi:signal peptidase I